MELLACIPARGGSKRIPHKNIVDFCGKPLLAYSIETALKSNIFAEVIVSTDDEKIAEVARTYGATVPFMRDDNLSDAYTGTFAVAKDAFIKVNSSEKNYDGICCIYATAPLLTPKYLLEGYNIFEKYLPDCVLSVHQFSYPIQRALVINKQGEVVYREPQYSSFRSQDLEKCYHDCGQFYYYSKKAVINNKIQNCLPLIMPNYRVIDIDTPEDLLYAKIMYKNVMEMHLE